MLAGLTLSCILGLITLLATHIPKLPKFEISCITFNFSHRNKIINYKLQSLNHNLQDIMNLRAIQPFQCKRQSIPFGLCFHFLSSKQFSLLLIRHRTRVKSVSLTRQIQCSTNYLSFFSPEYSSGITANSSFEFLQNFKRFFSVTFVNECFSTCSYICHLIY